LKLLFLLWTVSLFQQTASEETDYCLVGNANDLFIALGNHSCTTVAIDGAITVDQNIMVTRSMTLVGASPDAALIQGNPGKNGLYIRDVTSGITVRNLIIDGEGAQAALVVANVSNVSIRHCTVIGSPNIFAVFYAGHDVAAGSPTLNNYLSRVEMDSFNEFSDNIVRSTWSGDSLSFSLQYLGRLENNTVLDGGKIAFYMNANCTCLHNKVYSSISQGIFISTPSFGNIYMYNQLLDTKYAGIKIKVQVEHEDTEDRVFDMQGYYDVIQENIVESNSYIGVEVNDANCLGIYQNHILCVRTLGGIYLQNANDVVIWNNTFGEFPGAGPLANNVTSYPPSVSGIVQFDDALTYDANILQVGAAVSGGICAMPPVVPPPMPSATDQKLDSISQKHLRRSYHWKQKQKVKDGKSHLAFKLVRQKKDTVITNRL
jgi:hypothetical protein